MKANHLSFAPGNVWTLGMPKLMKNVYIDLKGELKPTPFKMPQDGLYLFDGQFFYHTKSSFKEL